MLQQLLAKKGLTYDDLTPEELSTFQSWVQAFEQKTLTLDTVREYLDTLILSVEQEVANYNLSKEQDLFLKARLKNYLLLKNLLTSPERAKKQIEQSLNNIKK